MTTFNHENRTLHMFYNREYGFSKLSRRLMNQRTKPVNRSAVAKKQQPITSANTQYACRRRNTGTRAYSIIVGHN